MFDFLAPFAAAILGIESLMGVFVVVNQMIARRGSL